MAEIAPEPTRPDVTGRLTEFDGDKFTIVFSKSTQI